MSLAWGQRSNANLRFSFLDSLAEKKIGPSSKFSLGNWRIDYSQSFLELSELVYLSPKIKFSFDKAIADYLHFDDIEDVATYALRMEEVAFIFDASIKEKEKKPQKIKISKISFPHLHMLKEFYSPRIEILIQNIRGNPNFNVPLVLTDVKVENMEIFPPKDVKPGYATLTSRGKIFDGNLSIQSRFNIFYSTPVLDINLKITDLSLRKLNAIFRQYGGVEIDEGWVNIFAEAAVKDDRLVGYIKLVSKHADLQKYWDEDDSFFENLKRALIGAGIEILDRTEADRIAGRIPFSGKIPDVSANIWQFVESLLVNAFVSPLQGGFRNQINLQDVEESDN